METDEITGQIVDAAMKVHTHLGPGLIESAYEAILAHELRNRGFTTQVQVGLPIVYEDVKLDIGNRINLLVEDCVIVGLKAVEKMIPLYDTQLLSCLKLSQRKIGLLINFNVPHLKDGIKRLAN